MTVCLLRRLSGLFFIVLTHFVHGQQQYVDGYLVKAPADTIRGLLLDEDWKKSPKEVYYKSSADAAPRRVPIGEVTAFHLTPTNEHFTAKPVTYQLYRREVYAGESPFLRTVQDTLFLQQLIRGGGITLYSLVDVREDQRFFFENGEVFTELVYYTYHRLKDQRRYAEEVAGYKGQLPFFLAGCKTLSFKTLSYTQASITHHVSAYLHCVHSDSIRVTPAKKVAVDASIAGGMLIFPRTTIPPTLSSAWPPWFPPTIAPSALVGVRLRMPKSLNRWFFLAEAGPIVNLPDDTHRSAMLFIISGGSYLGKGSIQPYVQAGMAFAGRSGSGANYGGGVTLGGGISYKKKIHLEVRNGLFFLVRIAI
jgi:hypothetical protein